MATSATPYLHPVTRVTFAALGAAALAQLSSFLLPAHLTPAALLRRLLGRGGAPAAGTAATATSPPRQTAEDDDALYEEMLLSDARVRLCRLAPPLLTAICGYNPAADAAEPVPGLQAFEHIKSRTHCLFAKRARVWGSRAWDPALDVAANVERSLAAFALFASVQRDLDGFVFSMAKPGASSTLADHAANVRALLNALSARDPSGYNAMTRSFIGKRGQSGSEDDLSQSLQTNNPPTTPQPPPPNPNKGWIFSFAREEFFVTTFGACYGADNARYTYGLTDHTFVLFQPYHSFLTHHVGQDTGETHWDAPQTARDHIRCRFRAAGQEYYIPEHPQSFPVAMTIVPPLHLDEPFLEWWREDADIPATAAE